MHTRITSVRKHFNLSMEAFGARIGLTKSMVSRMESGNNIPTDRTIMSICREFAVNEDWLRTGNGDMLLQDNKSILDRLADEYKVTDRERAVLTAFLNLSENDRAAIMRYVDNLVAELYSSSEFSMISASQKETPSTESTVKALPFRYSMQSASAGTGTYLGPEAFETMLVKETPLTRRVSFGIPVNGDSMEPQFHNGDMLLIERTKEIRIGEIGVFTLNGEGYVKELGDKELLSLNPEYQPIKMTGDISCNGRVIGVLDPALIISQ